MGTSYKNFINGSDNWEEERKKMRQEATKRQANEEAQRQAYNAKIRRENELKPPSPSTPSLSQNKQPLKVGSLFKQATSAFNKINDYNNNSFQAPQINLNTNTNNDSSYNIANKFAQGALSNYKNPQAIANEPSWGTVASNSLKSALTGSADGIVNMVRTVSHAVDNHLDNKDGAFINFLDNTHKYLDDKTQSYEKNLQGISPYSNKDFLSQGLKGAVQVGTMLAPGAVVSKGAKAAGLGAKAINAARMVPFGVQAGGNYASDAEKAGATEGQQLAYGLTGAAAEIASESFFGLGPLVNKFGKSGAKEILNNGADTLIKKYGKLGLSYAKDILGETAQEVAIDPVMGLAEKGIYNKDKVLVGKNGVLDTSQMKQDAFGGAAMSVLLSAIGLGSNTLSHRKASYLIENNIKPTEEDIKDIQNTMTEELKTFQSPEVNPGDAIPGKGMQNPNAVNPNLNIQGNNQNDNFKNIDTSKINNTVNVPSVNPNLDGMLNNYQVATKANSIAQNQPVTSGIEQGNINTPVTNNVAENEYLDINNLSNPFENDMDTFDTEQTTNNVKSGDIKTGETFVSKDGKEYEIGEVSHKDNQVAIFNHTDGLQGIVSVSQARKLRGHKEEKVIKPRFNIGDNIKVGNYKVKLKSVNGNTAIVETETGDREIPVKDLNKKGSKIFQSTVINNTNKTEAVSKPGLKPSVMSENNQGNVTAPIENKQPVNAPKAETKVNTNLETPKTIEPGQKYKTNFGEVTVKENDGAMIKLVNKSGTEIPIGVKAFNNIKPKFLGSEAVAKEEAAINNNETIIDDNTPTEDLDNPIEMYKVENKNEIIEDRPSVEAYVTNGNKQGNTINPIETKPSQNEDLKENEYKENDEVLLNHEGKTDAGIVSKINNDGTYEIQRPEGDYVLAKKNGDTFETIKSEPTPKDQIPLDERTNENVGNRKVKAYQFLHPELKHYIQSEANILQGELRETIPADAYMKPTYEGESSGVVEKYTRTKRVATQDIAYLKDTLKASYEDIGKALDNIIKDNGSENNALSKKIELLIDHRLSNGYTDMMGNDIPGNDEYVARKNEIEGIKAKGERLKENEVAEPEVKEKQEDNHIADTSQTIDKPQEIKEEVKEDKKDISYKNINNLNHEELLQLEKELKEKVNDEYWTFTRTKSSKVSPNVMVEAEVQLKEVQKKLGKRKEFYEMTKEEAKRKLRMPENKHREYVEKALNDGKQIPEEVLKDYPDLTETKKDIASMSKEEVSKGNTLDKWLDTISKDDINYDKAYNAYRAISFEPDRRAESEQKGYVNAMNDIYEKMSKLAETPEQKTVLLNELNKYKENYLKHMNEILSAKSRTMSAMITGPARFPTARNEKALQAEHNKVVAFLEWQKRAEKSIKKALEGSTTPEQATDKEFNRLKDEAMSTIATLKGIENGTDKGYSPTLFRNSLRDKLMRSLNNGNVETVSKVLDLIKETEKEHLKKPVFASNNGIWKAVETAKEKLKNEPETKTGTETIKKYDGVEIIKNFEADRVQLLFDEKPSEEIRAELKKSGWHFSPSNNVWQRKLTSNAEYAAKRVMDKYFKEETGNNGEFSSKSNNIKAYMGTATTTRNIISATNSAKKPLPRKQIIDDLIKKLDIPNRTGRINTKNALGIYKENQEVIRTKLAEDVPILSHEIGHHLDKLYGLSKFVTKNNDYNKEIMNLGQEQAKLQKLDKKGQISEGIAEFLREYLSGEDVSEYKFTSIFEKMINKDIRKALQTFRKEYAVYLNASPGDKIISQVSFGNSRKTIGEKVKEKVIEAKTKGFSKFYTTWIDELRPTYDLVKQGKVSNISSDIHKMAWLFRGWSGKAMGAIKGGVYNYNSEGKLVKVSDGLNEILKPIAEKDMDKFRQYIISKRVIEKEGQGIRTGFNLADAETIVNQVEKLDNNTEFINAHEKLQVYQDAILQRLVDGGLMSKEQYKKIKELNKDYVPFYRALSLEESGGKYTGETFGNVKSPVKKMKGGNASIIDPIESMVKNTYYFTNLAERNLVAQSLVKFSEENEGMGKFVENVTPKFSASTFELKEIKKSLEDAGADLEDADLEQMATVFRPIVKGNSAENIVTVTFGGKPRLYQIEPNLYRSIMGLDKESSNLIFQVMNMATKTLRAGAVLNPDFAARNIARDTLGAFMYSKGKYTFYPVIDNIRGLYHVIKKDEIYNLWMNSGAAQSEFVSMDRDYLSKGVREVMSKGKPLDLLKEFLANPLAPLQYLSSISEESTRVGYFNKAYKKEGNSRESIANIGLDTRDLTLDFSRSGTAGKNANKVIAFFNATLQGQDKTIRAFKNPETRMSTLIKTMIAITLPSIVLWMKYHDDEKIKELPAWRKNLYWNIPTENYVISIPKPFELGILFGSLVERALDFAYDNDEKAMKEWSKEFLGNIIPGVLPTIVGPAIENWVNYSFFRGTNIETQSDKNLPAYERYSTSTSLMAKKIGEAATKSPFTKEGISPKKIDNLIQGYTAGLGKYTVEVIDKLLGSDYVKPSSTLRQFPIAKGFLAEPYTQSRTVEDFYEDKTNITKEYTMAVKKYREENPNIDDKEWTSILKNNITPYKEKIVKKLPSELSELHKQKKAYDEIGEYLSGVREMQQSIYKDNSLSASVKQGKINQSNYETIQFLKRAKELSYKTIKSDTKKEIDKMNKASK